MAPIVARKSLSLNHDDVVSLAALASSPERRRALARLVREPLASTASEAKVLHAIYVAGIRAVEAEAMRDGYAEVAAEEAEYDRSAVARRRAPRWAEE